LTSAHQEAWRLCDDFALKVGRQTMSYGDEVLVDRFEEGSGPLLSYDFVGQ
jgi:hypothetical protein